MAVVGKASHKEMLWKFSLEMAINEGGMHAGWGGPSAGYSPFPCTYSPCEAALLKKTQSILHKRITKTPMCLKDGLQVASGA